MRIKTGMAAALLAAVTLTGCGADPADPAGQDKASIEQQQALEWAQCMRDNGIDMEDPEVNANGGVNMTIPEDADPDKVDAATEECKKLAPNGGEPEKIDPEKLNAVREYAQCMRDNGIPNFPDPDEDGGIALDADKLGLDPVGPEMKAAEEKCKDRLPDGPGSGNNEGKEK